jgi:streptogrisin D
MRFRERTISKPSVIVAAAGLVAGALTAVYVTPLALKSDERGARSSTKAVAPSAVAAKVERLLGDRSAGSYLARGRLMVPVTNAADARTVRAAGGVPTMVENSGQELDAASATIRRTTSKITGTGWARDPRTNKMVVWADDTVRGAKLARVRQMAAELGDTVRVRRINGKLRLKAAGGDAIFGEQSRCSLGFNVQSAQGFGFVTAGHCGNAEPTWAEEQGAEPVASTEESSFPGDDMAIAIYENQQEEPPGVINLGNGETQEIANARDAVVGEAVQRMGSTTGLNDGQVLEVDATVTFPEGTVTGMIHTDVCAEPGDSGGPLFAGDSALGLTSGGSGDCQAGGETFFQPVTEALDTFGAEVL